MSTIKNRTVSAVLTRSEWAVGDLAHIYHDKRIYERMEI